MRTLEPANRKRIGLMGLIVTVMVVGVGQTLTSTPQLFAEPSYYGLFTDSGQLNKGDKVRIAGVDVGDVEAIKIDGDHIQMKVSTGSQTIGTESRLAIKTDTILGKKVLEIEPRGSQDALTQRDAAYWAEHHPATRFTTRSSTSPRPPPAGTSTRSNSRCMCCRRPSIRRLRT